MNLELYLAQRLQKKTTSRFSSYPSSQIATLAISLSVTVMILATAIVTGFQNEIRDKVIGFGSHIQITHFSDGNSYESKKVSQIDSIKQSLAPIAEVIHIQKFATKAGIIKLVKKLKALC